MGGTTAKTGVVRDGRPDITHDFQVGGKGSFGGTAPGTGFPVKIPVVDLAEVGAGGGSVAWVDVGGAPPCRAPLGRRRPRPGLLRPGRDRADGDRRQPGARLPRHRSGGRAAASACRPSSPRRPSSATWPGRSGSTVPEAARAVHDIANANMAAAIRVVTVQRGIDPRAFDLVGFGGAGPMHAARARRAPSGSAGSWFPGPAGVASAVGLISADPSVERVLTHLMAEDELDPATLEKVFAGVEAQCVADLPATAGDGDDVVQRAADVRFRGQAHQLTVPVASGSLGAAEVAGMIDAFRRRYFEAYGIDLAAPCELVTVRVRLTRPVPTFRPLP